MFESFVNSERCKTGHAWKIRTAGLRALLIQKDVKQCLEATRQLLGLRALLIQKDVKRQVDYSRDSSSLRALLIQKDVKRFV